MGRRLALRARGRGRQPVKESESRPRGRLVLSLIELSIVRDYRR